MIIICQKYDTVISSDELGVATIKEDKVTKKHEILITLRGDKVPIVAASYDTAKEAKESMVKMAGALYNDARVYRFFRPFDGEEEAKKGASIKLSGGTTA